MTFDPRMLDFIASQAAQLDIIATAIEAVERHYDPLLPAAQVRAAADALRTYVREERDLAAAYTEVDAP